jgi:hypothetical protein
VIHLMLSRRDEMTGWVQTSAAAMFTNSRSSMLRDGA